MKAIRIPVFVLAVLLAFSVCNAVHLTRRCALWQAKLTDHLQNPHQYPTLY